MLARSDNYFHEDGKWYFRTQDGVMGPFNDKSEAQMAVLYFHQRTKWPNARQLRDFMGTDSHDSRRSQIG
jgi:hypothetical protein